MRLRELANRERLMGGVAHALMPFVDSLFARLNCLPTGRTFD
jgi:hypothetical protein